MNKANIAIVGATGLVGRTFIKVLEEKNLPIDKIFFFASERSKGSEIKFCGDTFTVEELTETSFDRGIDIALFSAGANVSKKFSPIAASKGTIVIDNSSMFRMDPDVPLVVPEVNPEDIWKHNRIIANPNCSTIQAMVALKPLDVKYRLKRVIYTTFQSVSGAGKAGITDLENGVNGISPQKFPYQIFGNCIPQIDDFLPDGYTKEEAKMINETRKILHLPNLNVTATAVRVPVAYSHSESINVEFEKEFVLDELKEILRNSDGIILRDEPERGIYPMAIDASGKDEVFIGRLRRDESIKSGINMWVVADNIRKGAATNAVQIAEIIIKS